jgi:hypothetical protein
MNLGDKRAGGINHFEPASPAALTNRWRDAVCRVDDALAIRHIIDFVDKDGAFFSEFVDNVAIVDNLAAHVDGGAEGFKSDFNDVDGANYTGAKTARLKKKNALPISWIVALGVIGDGIERGYRHIDEYTNLMWQTFMACPS